jgi:hypothetical protein
MTTGFSPGDGPTPEPATERRQLDLFLDGQDAFLVHEITSGLVQRNRDRAEAGLERLRHERPLHPDLSALALLITSLDSPAVSPATHATVTDDIEAMQNALAPAARRLVGESAAAFLERSWRSMAARAAHLPFDETHPRAHRSWLCQQYADWAAVRAAVEAESRWSWRPCLRYRLGLARHHLGEPEVAMQVWLPLCWMDPGLFSRCAPTLPSAILREAWEAFEHTFAGDDSLADTTEVATWFPAWLLVRHRGLVHLFRSDEVPEAGTASRTFRHLLSLLPLESQGLNEALVRERRALQQLSPSFFHYYMQVVPPRGARA